MGMHDYLRIAPDLLPIDEEEQALLKEACQGEFQTKSVVNYLTMVEITPQGRLRWQQEEEDYMLEHPRWVEETTFTGAVNFYHTLKGTRYEFCALFAQGQLLKIVKIAP